ncbi:hypothetical protein F5Y15DRAFT_404753 [Xylariaceae sp. FL0016]|nr:hypothetical protein F5Y15DRAFT_404753 [Xylariaceae sp. FL0016]
MNSRHVQRDFTYFIQLVMVLTRCEADDDSNPGDAKRFTEPHWTETVKHSAEYVGKSRSRTRSNEAHDDEAEPRMLGRTIYRRLPPRSPEKFPVQSIRANCSGKIRL